MQINKQLIEYLECARTSRRQWQVAHEQAVKVRQVDVEPVAKQMLTFDRIAARFEGLVHKSHTK